MPTPTSPDRTPNPQSAELTPADAIDAFGRGSFSSAAFRALSDLGRDDARLLAARWPRLSAETREAIARGLAELAESDVSLSFHRVFRIALDDESAVVRQLAISALWEDERLDLADRFLTIAQEDPSEDVRAEAIQGLSKYAIAIANEEIDGDLGDRIQEALNRLLDDPRSGRLERRRALETIANFGGTPQLTERIMLAFDDDDPSTQASAIYAMGRSLDRRWLPTVLDAFTSDDAELRYEAARASGELGITDAVLGLSELVLDEDAEVRTAAIDALGKIGGPPAVRVLRALLRRDEDVDRAAVEEALDEALLSVETGRG